MTSYQLSQTVNTQSILWAIGGAVVAAIHIIAKLLGLVLAAEPYILGAVTGLVLGLAMFAVISAIPVTFWLGLLITGAFGWATFPKSKAVN